MPLDMLVTCVLIILARIGDVSLGTLRTIAIVNGRAVVSWILGFFEVLIWLFAVTRVFERLNDPEYAIVYTLAYAFGFATGNFVGVRVEGLLALGEQVIRVFTRCGAELAGALRRDGYRVTEFDGRGRDGLVSLLFIELPRKEVRQVLGRVHAADPQSFSLVDDVRMASSFLSRQRATSGWRAILKRK